MKRSGFASEHRTQEATATRPARLCVGDPENPAVLLLHGAMMDRRMFAPLIAALEDRFHVIAVDLPGHGQSRQIPFSTEACLAGVQEILGEERVRTCHLVGQSMGGFVCQLLMRQMPGLALSLTLIGSLPLSAPVYRLKAPFVRFVDLLIRVAPLAFTRQFAALTAGARPKTRAYIKSCTCELTRRALASIFSGSASMLETGSYPALSVPVLLIHGTRDLILFGFNRIVGRCWAAGLGVTVHPIAGASHNANMDRPEVVNRLILDHLQKRAEPET
jgi:pimeloyl-ACP methyl ester carboxylesterase